MNVIQNLIKNQNKLENFIDNNSTAIIDFFQQDFKTISFFRNDIERFISLNLNQLKELDILKYSDFIFLLLETSEKLGLVSQFNLLYNILKENNIKVSNRQIASSLFLTEIDSSEYLKRYDSLVNYLSKAYELEEDNEDKITFTYINYFSQALSYWGEYNKTVILEIKEKISNTLKTNKYSFLKNKNITQILNLNIDNFSKVFEKVKILSDSILGINYLENIQKYDFSDFLIETNTHYAKNIKEKTTNFLAIRQWNKEVFSQLPNSDTIFRQLRRGVHILETSEQLTAYMNSYGRMHYYKLESAFEKLPTSFYNNEIEIIDWGCGQGVASMVYLTQLQQNQKIAQYTLIEPSQIAIKRASLHIKHFENTANIVTVNKDLNELFKINLQKTTNKVKLHFFSNILDIETFSLNSLISYINENFKGLNYFVIVSPFIPNSRRLRINEFVNNFKNMQDFKLFYNIDNQSGEWKNNWSRMIRVFKVTV